LQLLPCRSCLRFLRRSDFQIRADDVHALDALSHLPFVGLC
jgi:hypothetical protein